LVTTAPTWPQVRNLLWREIRRIHVQGRLPGELNLTEWWINDQLVGFGRKPDDQNAVGIQGIHAKYVLVILDEACGVAKPIWDAVDTLIANDDSRILAIGNPDDPATEFFEVCKPGSGWETERCARSTLHNRDVVPALVQEIGGRGPDNSSTNDDCFHRCTRYSARLMERPAPTAGCVGKKMCQSAPNRAPRSGVGKPSDPGRSGKDNRLFVEAVLWIVRTGSPWRDRSITVRFRQFRCPTRSEALSWMMSPTLIMVGRLLRAGSCKPFKGEHATHHDLSAHWKAPPGLPEFRSGAALGALTRRCHISPFLVQMASDRSALVQVVIFI
jgi:hypothetical protein